MPFAAHRGQRIHYTVEGAGPLVVLQHGLLMDAKAWKQGGIVGALAQHFQVACIDSLGHGLSDKPSDPALYDQQQRAGDIVAVIDDLGSDRAHLVGHSMGAWMAVGAARYHSRRLSSLVLGGWDIVSGLPRVNKGPLRYEAFIAFARRGPPNLLDWVTRETEPGVRACFDALFQLEGARDAVLGANVPVMIWEGQRDPAHDQRKEFAKTNGWQFLSTAGDHLGMLLAHGAETARGIRAFVDQAKAT
ncbi:MAG: alpha/beta fold hydrolase [Bradyrhizobium sp.]|uniref:alpha/beta fold hydrolase n=1 Tax=Bradyrhizobium sp. TaxID=376 RepID=UPI001C28E8AD|nr:alpha/beta hydrolase [Bradyrhizobium sp.]MBU6461478.1 alpha/beta fold hydrolase [Pseudomonadota bacterium]MDE2068540.1 alpha/beta fold hydrolase [Bradyrhizobium sp.]MDE2243529.1 alpha/beta fold hydrolase [Bradyrhizobium sp.]MDE2468949.1 alpha/beta fold hydrolase [Bradyrhizobium sp.]